MFEVRDYVGVGLEEYSQFDADKSNIPMSYELNLSGGGTRGCGSYVRHGKTRRIL